MITVPHVQKTALVAVGSGLVTAAAYLPAPWQLIVALIGGLLGGKALFKRPGDIVPQKVDVPL